MRNFKVALSQYSPSIGNIAQNAQNMLALAQQAQQQGADIIVFPELALIGYPPEDLLLRPSLLKRTQQGLSTLQQAKDIIMLAGYVHVDENGQRYNSAALIKNGEILGIYHKQNLPNYSVFDEERYFEAGHQHLIFEHAGHKFGILICEDIWIEKNTQQLSKLGVDTILVLNASPYEAGKPQQRQALVSKLAQQYNLNIVYVNQVGGQDDLIFDGASTVINGDGEIVAQAKLIEQQMLYVDFDAQHKKFISQEKPQTLDTIAEIYQLLVMSVRDYVNNSGFPGVILGLSGGIDSALTLAIAVDALGANRVQAVMMPYTYTAQISVEDAAAQAQRLGITFGIAEINPIVNGFMQTLTPFFGNSPADATEENLQARSRGTLLMALSNKFGNLVLSTGNKSELAVGYCTLYGDMVGGFAPLKDVYKTIVFELAKYRNSIEETPVIPERVITRPPSAELRPDQKDQDSLPTYDILDAILYMYIEEDLSQEDIIQKGFDADVVKKIIRLVDRNEYKRRQGAIGPRISSRAFGRERRYPIVNGWTAGL
ncbi:NAD+ synthase [Acinetobacter qingfengensis]|uniref:Glutamine-dependent NAD(+) synthetase n=1 Tax=Acinetobacter qingfengensis TaxID=1262585 RepID=A0A1E7RDY4_9GAMM|nr:NAD+ synthase [Acinetobacter qingfengensis]KAA8734372.1 NAD+ synthase [Acinetobacter qingfengensis]OEY97620.1 NAD+ synthase [Acinetobacter qingfengensis]